MAANIDIIEANWAEHKQQLVRIRTQVFILEQRVSIDLEWDGQDETAQHLLAVTDMGEAVGCARLMHNGSIGRMAVLEAWRGHGAGSALLKAAIAWHQQQGARVIRLSAQVHAIDFYEKAGFIVCSQPYVDADILHVDMQLFMPVNC